ncbi:hypothetical protein PG999_007796 [Apiospora kogelbergensis]|uniref:Carboxylic ester hydrolase n=1 Tax=Apiospora kogelbergensis TaxID=1337665 RepID=A0AAW0QSY5_9PEZI
MSRSLFLALPGVLSLLTVTSAIPSVSSVGSDLQILLHNDLYGNQSARGEAVIVLRTAQTQEDAAKACVAIGESLWSPASDPKLNDFLAYLSYGMEDESDSIPIDQLWVSSTSKGVCNTITSSGQTGSADCTARLPGLCTQSAALYSVNGTDTEYQTQVSAGDAVYTGYRDKLSFRFLGIRYGSYPERFTYSSPVSASGEVSALQFGSVCRQRTALIGSEDCLYLNIYTPFIPASTGGNLKPVMLYIHGGAFLSGSGSDAVFDGGNLASRGDVVVITINYRLGTFGFLVYGNNTGLNGNYGIGDMVTALEWVQRNIASFGGDPDHVTVFGQSAGAEGIRALLQSPPAAGLFSAAIMESDPRPAVYTRYLKRDQEVALQTMPILTLSGCVSGDVDAEVACLRNYDAASFFSLATIPANNPVVDGHYVLSPAIPFNGTGHVNKVPLLIGHMRDESASDLAQWLQTDNLTLSLASNGLPTLPAAEPDVFPIAKTDNSTTAIWNVTVQVSTESTFSCLDQATAYAAATTSIFPEVYYYQFNRSYQITTYPSGFPNKQLCNAPVTPTHPHGDPDGEYYKCHSGELTTVFGTWRLLGLPERDDNDTPFTQAVIDRWSSFGKTYNPNPDPTYLAIRGYTNTTLEITTSGAWDPVTADSQTLRQLQWPSRQDLFPAKDRCVALGQPLDYFLQPSAQVAASIP